MKKLNKNELKAIEKELNAFNENFEEITIKQNSKNYFVYQELLKDDKYLYKTNHLVELKGWLYGAIQSNNNILKTRQYDCKRNNKLDSEYYNWNFERGGSFMKSICKAISIADNTNLEKLYKSFPSLVNGYINNTRGMSFNEYRKETKNE